LHSDPKAPQENPAGFIMNADGIRHPPQGRGRQQSQVIQLFDQTWGLNAVGKRRQFQKLDGK
jgi:hypothetical protein